MRKCKEIPIENLELYNQNFKQQLFEHVETKNEVESIINALNSEERYLLQLKIFGGLKFSEISELTGINENTLRVRFFRAIKKIRDKIKKA